MALNYGLLGGIIGIGLIILFAILFFAYRSRSAPVLRIFGSQYFRFEILSPARKTTIVNRMTKDFKIIGKVILFKAPGGMYKVVDECIFLREKIPTSIYKFGNPLPINVYGHETPIVKIWDEDNKTFVENKMSSQELQDAIESKVVHDLNKFTFNRLEMIMIVVSALALIINFVVVYEIVQVNSEFGTLINQLNQILAQLPKASSPAVP